MRKNFAKVKLPDFLTDNKKKIFLSIVTLTAISLLFAAICYKYLCVGLWDYDFWWHIASGRLIVNEGHLPDADHFSFTSAIEGYNNPHPLWENFVLRQYWISQVLFYVIFNNTGPGGIVILRSLLLVVTIFIVFWHIYRVNRRLPFAFIFSFLLFTISIRFIGERPVLFSIMFTALSLSILENYRSKIDRKIFILPFVMLLWSNMHGGFIIGIVIISAYMLGEGIKAFFRKSSLSKKELALFYASTSIALIASYLNPTGWDAFQIAFSSKYNIFWAGVQEWQSPISLYLNKVRPLEFSYVILGLLCPLLLIIKNRRLDIAHFILISCFFYGALTAERYVIYYAIVVIMISGREFNAMADDLLYKRMGRKSFESIYYYIVILSACSVLLFAIGVFASGKIKLEVEKNFSVPEGAVNFIDNNQLEGNIFNEYRYGGYLIWRFPGKKRVFIDGRSLHEKFVTEYKIISGAREYVEKSQITTNKAPAWDLLLDRYKTDLILMSTFDLSYEVPGLIFKLLSNDKWVPVYCDNISIVFIRNIEQNKAVIKKFRLPKEDIYETLVGVCLNFAIRHKSNPRIYMSLGESFYGLGRTDDAIKAYQLALQKMPGNRRINDRILQFKETVKGNQK